MNKNAEIPFTLWPKIPPISRPVGSAAVEMFKRVKAHEYLISRGIREPRTLYKVRVVPEDIQ